MPRKDSTAFAHDLQTLILTLEREIEAKVGEVDRARAALKALYPDGLPASAPKVKPSSAARAAMSAQPPAWVLVVDLLKRRESGFVVTADLAAQLLVDEADWRTTSNDPVNAVRAALARAAERGWLIRVSEGRYTLADNVRETAEADASTVAVGGSG